MQTAIAPQAHTAQQPGLRGHSWNPASDLLKRFLLLKSRGPEQGWLAVASFDTEAEAREHGVIEEVATNTVHKITDQWAR